jgi:hypothetical protein
MSSYYSIGADEAGFEITGSGDAKVSGLTVRGGQEYGSGYSSVSGLRVLAQHLFSIGADEFVVPTGTASAKTSSPGAFSSYPRYGVSDAHIPGIKGRVRSYGGIINLIGDSIRIGSEPRFRSLIDYAVVSTDSVNNQSSSTILANIYDWILSKDFEVLLINCGLWDILRAGGKPNPCAVSKVVYEENLRTIFDAVRNANPSSILMFRSITAIVEQWMSPTQMCNSDIVEYNAIAKSVVESYPDAYYLDVYNKELKDSGYMWNGDGIHRTEEGYCNLALIIYESFKVALGQPVHKFYSNNYGFENKGWHKSNNVKSASPDNSYAYTGYIDISLQSASDCRGLIQFNLAGIDANRFVTARIHFYNWQEVTEDISFDLFKCKTQWGSKDMYSGTGNDAPVTNEACWNKSFYSTVDWASGAISDDDIDGAAIGTVTIKSGDPVGTRYSVDVTAQLREMIGVAQYGFITKGTAIVGQSGGVISMNGTLALRPILDIEVDNITDEFLTFEAERNDPDLLTTAYLTPDAGTVKIRDIAYVGINDKIYSAGEEIARNYGANAGIISQGSSITQRGALINGTAEGGTVEPNSFVDIVSDGWWGGGSEVDAPTAPVIADVLPLSATGLRIYTSLTAGASRVHIERSLSATSGFVEVAQLTSGFYYDDILPALVSGREYFYRARAWNSAGYSSYSAVVADTTRVSNGVEQALWSTFKTKMQADTYLSTYVTTWQFSREATIFPESAFPVFKAWIIDTAEDWKGVPKSKIVKPRVIIHALVKTATAVLLETEKLKADEYIKNALEADMTFAGGVTMNIVGDTIFSNKDDTTAEIFITCEILSSRFTAGAR